MKIINEHEIGVCKGTELEKIVQANFNGETQEVGCTWPWHARPREKELPEVAEVLSTIAIEEPNTLLFAEMNE
jgi:rubrerythrin